MKAQVDVIAIVIIVGIVTALTGSAYLWGAPIIEKRSTLSDYKIAESFILDLDKKITDIAGSGGGEANIKIPIGSAKIVSYGTGGVDNNSIIFEFITKQPLIMGDRSYIKTTVLGDSVPYGSEPRVISVSGAAAAGKGYVITIKLRYRDLLMPSGDISTMALSTTSVSWKPNAVQIRYDRSEKIGSRHITWVSVNVQ